MCPDCRFVFRVPRDHDGTGIICPGCRCMLRIPQPGDQTVPLMAPLKKIGVSGDSAGAPEVPKRGQRKKKQTQAEQPDWEASAGTWRSNRNKGRRATLQIAAWAGSMAAIVLVIGLIMKLTGEEQAGKGEITPPVQDQFDDLIGQALLVPDEELEDQVELPKVMKRSENEFLAAAEPMAKTFLEATQLSEILPVIHDRKRVEPLMRKYYPTGKIEPTGLSKFNTSGQVSYKDSFAAVSLLTPDYERKQLAYIDGEDGLKIDWESWVGWSEVPWDELKEKKPAKPVLIRTMAKWVDYYNFGFADENAWRSYRLVSPDGETTLYGYVERNSLLDQRLRPGEAGSTVAVTLKIHFRKDEQAPNQVVIDEYVADGWVVPQEPK